MITAFALPWTSSRPPNGIPSDTRGYNAEMKLQNSSWTRTGVPRKNQMYSQLEPETSGLGERRITASTTPSVMPIAIEMAVSSSVTTRPWRTRLEKK